MKTGSTKFKVPTGKFAFVKTALKAYVTSGPALDNCMRRLEAVEEGYSEVVSVVNSERVQKTLTMGSVQEEV